MFAGDGGGHVEGCRQRCVPICERNSGRFEQFARSNCIGRIAPKNFFRAKRGQSHPGGHRAAQRRKSHTKSHFRGRIPGLFSGPCAPRRPCAADTIDARFRRAIALFCAREGMSSRTFGMAALNDPGFVAALARGRSPRLSTADRVLAIMGEPLAGPAFRAEVEAFLKVTGAKRSLLGRAATGLRQQLRRGMSPRRRSAGCGRGWSLMPARRNCGPWTWTWPDAVRRCRAAGRGLLPPETGPEAQAPGREERNGSRAGLCQHGRCGGPACRGAPWTATGRPARGRRSTASAAGYAIAARTWMPGRSAGGRPRLRPAPGRARADRAAAGQVGRRGRSRRIVADGRVRRAGRGRDRDSAALHRPGAPPGS